MAEPAITSFLGDYFFLSNFYRRAFFCEHPVFGRSFGLTSEHHFQAAKAYARQDWLLVHAASSPGEAKRRGRRIERNRNWDEVKIDIMRSILQAKFADPILRAKLLATGEAELIEGNTWGDRFWGAVWIPLVDRDHWEGENWLGKLLMEIRDGLRSSNG